MVEDPIRVLMVDDDEDDFIIVRDLLREAGNGRYRLVWVSSVQEALEMACKGEADVVLADYRLGADDGISFVKEVRRRNCNAPVILLTGQGDRSIDLAAMDAGAADFLGKASINSDVLERTIRYAYAAKRAEEQRLSLQAERAARVELEAAAKAKDEFLAMLSHELRTPMTPVLMTVSAMQGDTSLPSGVQDDLALIRRNVELQVKLVDDLLDLTRFSRGKLELHEEVADIHELIAHAHVTACVTDPRCDQLTIKHTLLARRRYVWGDKARLEQVLWNLMKNAVKFTPPGGTIEVSTHNPPGGGIAISVSDTGVGIEAEMLPMIFNAFEQGSRTVTRRFGGLGLGLAICKAIVELHGGTIAAQSEGKDKGSVFTVTLPVTHAPSGLLPSTEEAAPMEPPRSTTKLSVLLVEDSVATLKVMSRLFRDFGYEVTPAADIASARMAAKGRTFDLVVSDLGLPDGSGLELMRDLRDQYGLKGIALSGYGQAEDIIESQNAGFAEHLVKPVDFARLEAAVRRVTNSI